MDVNEAREFFGRANILAKATYADLAWYTTYIESNQTLQEALYQQKELLSMLRCVGTYLNEDK